MDEQQSLLSIDDLDYRPPCEPSDAYFMITVFFGRSGEKGGHVEFFCDSHYSINLVCDVLQNVASGKQKGPVIIPLLATPELIDFVESGPPGVNCIPTLAKELVVIPAERPTLFSFELTETKILELHAGVEAAEFFYERFYHSLSDIYDGGRELWVIKESWLAQEPLKNSGSAGLVTAWATWPRTHASPKAALNWVQKGLYLKHPPGENDWADADEA